MSKFTFQDPISPIMYGISALHDHILFFLALILFVVAFIFITTVSEFTYSLKKTPRLVQDDLDFLFELPRS
jgi:heme/copper-type cytochrome/quinol oxidase subunit 2